MNVEGGVGRTESVESVEEEHEAGVYCEGADCLVDDDLREEGRDDELEIAVRILFWKGSLSSLTWQATLFVLFMFGRFFSKQ